MTHLLPLFVMFALAYGSPQGVTVHEVSVAEIGLNIRIGDGSAGHHCEILNRSILRTRDQESFLNASGLPFVGTLSVPPIAGAVWHRGHPLRVAPIMHGIYDQDQ